MAVYTSDNALHTYKVSDLIFANLDGNNQMVGIGNNDGNIFMNNKEGPEVVIN